MISEFFVFFFFSFTFFFFFFVRQLICVRFWSIQLYYYDIVHLTHSSIILYRNIIIIIVFVVFVLFFSILCCKNCVNSQKCDKNFCRLSIEEDGWLYISCHEVYFYNILLLYITNLKAIRTVCTSYNILENVYRFVLLCPSIRLTKKGFSYMHVLHC